MAITSSAPSISQPAAQQQSPLFRLPRELRNEIYEIYVYDDEGLAYEYSSKTLKYASGKELNLPLTCKTIANEMRGLALRFNTITFTSSFDKPEGDSFRRLRSTSSRFENLLHSARWTKMVMLHFVAELVTDNILSNVLRAYPCVSSVFRSAFRAIQNGSGFYGMRLTDRLAQDVFTTSFCDAVQYTLDQVAMHPRFDSLASKACGSPTHYPGRRSPFLEGTHQKVLDWRQNPWNIPSLQELQEMEQLLTPVMPSQWDWTREYQHVKLYFSATAICIDALGRLQPDARSNIRSIVLQEEARSISNPEAHAEGLIPFCVGNPRLRIHMQAGFSTNLAPSCWAKSDAVTDPPGFVTWTLLHDHIRILIEWLIRLAALPSQGMPSACFVAELEAHSKEAAHIWNSTVKAAQLRGNVPDSMADDEDRNSEYGHVLTEMFSFVWRLPIQLVTVIEDIASQDSPIRLGFRDGELSPVTAVVEDYSTWSQLDWMRSYYPMAEHVDFPGDSGAYFRKHFVDFESSL